ncbi:hypothetical protein ACFXPS_22895 [Nocardia sp. NPDC059091]
MSFAHHDLPAEIVTMMTAAWEDAPAVYAAHTTKLVLHRTVSEPGD